MPTLPVILITAALGLCTGCQSRHVASPAPEPKGPSEQPEATKVPSKTEAQTPDADPLPEGLVPPSEPASSDDTRKTATAKKASSRAPASAAGAAPKKATGTPATTPAKQIATAPDKSAAPTTPTSSKPTSSKPATAAAPVKKTVIPQTAHVRFEVPAGMRALLDADPRMEGWLKGILPIIDKCYQENSRSSGVITVGLTMHESRRPSTSIKSLPGSLASLVPCATSRLMNARPPLFTGPEGASYTIGIRFTP